MRLGILGEIRVLLLLPLFTAYRYVVEKKLSALAEAENLSLEEYKEKFKIRIHD